METAAVKRGERAATMLNASVISLISDEEEDTASSESEPEWMEAEETGDDLTRFLIKDERDGVNATHLKEAVQACSCTPYCLYLYTGVQQSAGRTTSVVLVRYLDQSSGTCAVRPLLALQMSADTNGVPGLADSDAQLLVEALEEVELPLSNLAVFYCDASHPAVCRAILSRLKALSPAVISLCSLPTMAARACQAGLLASFSYVPVLIQQLRHHYVNHASNNATLKQLFAGAEHCAPSGPASTHCLFIIDSVQKMASCWRALVDHFMSLKPTEEIQQIRKQLMDPKVKLEFFFLSEVLQPLRVLQELHQSAGDDVAKALQMVSAVVRSYADRILWPASAKLLLKSRNLQLLRRGRDLLPLAEVKVGSLAREFLWATPAVDLGDEDRRCFPSAVQSFYRAALESLVESVPEQLEDLTLWNISTVLKDPGKLKDGEVYEQVLPALGVQLGLCDAGTLEAKQLVDDFLSVVGTVKADPKRTGADGHCWTKVLQRMRPTTLQRLLLTLVALPTSLHRAQVFAQMALCSRTHQKTSAASTGSDKWARNAAGCLRKLVVPAGGVGGRRARPPELSSSSSSSSSTSFSSSSSDDDDNASSVVPQKPSNHRINCGEDSDGTDNSSDVVDVTKELEPLRDRRLVKSQNSGRSLQPQPVCIVSSDEEENMDSSFSSPTTAGPDAAFNGDLVWGHVEGFSVWPAIVVPGEGSGSSCPPGMTKVKWYGQQVMSNVTSLSLTPFAEFSHNFCHKSFGVFDSYREAIHAALQEAALRSRKQFTVPVADRERRLKEMVQWAHGGFPPSGPSGLKPTTSCVTPSNGHPPMRRRSLPKVASSSSLHLSKLGFSMKQVSVSLTRLSCDAIKGRPAPDWSKHHKGKKDVMKKKRSKGTAKMKEDYDWREEEEEWGEEEEEEEEEVRGKGWRGRRGPRKSREGPDNRRRTSNKGFIRASRETNPYIQPDQGVREKIIRRIIDEDLDIDKFCLCCGTQNIICFHPLFKGSLCLKCKDNFTETLYRYDEDGYQSYCTICCYGLEVVLCGNQGCCRSYCGSCVDILVGSGTFDSLKLLDPWICYMCQPHRAHGALVPRDDWSIRVHEVFANNSAMEFEPHRMYPCIPANQRRPLRVLSLFDGIATGYVVLKELGLKLEKYIASEVCEDSISVATINHDGRIIHVGDVRCITKEQLDRWGPFDLLIGGSPCNDLAIVNPLRKGLYEGTGRLFFDYYRILHMLKPKEDDPRPFFWLFENVVFMNMCDRVNICRFMECNPVLVDAIAVSPAHRARYFWGNIPGMNRPIIASKNDKLNLQDCLELGRKAQVDKVRTITTNPNCLKQGKNKVLLPVLQDGREDHLWVTELERIFGFPKHYTDVRNMGKNQRLMVLGKSWSVPVIRHLFAPLKDYFACEELLPVASSSSSSSSSPPASPDVSQL